VALYFKRSAVVKRVTTLFFILAMAPTGFSADPQEPDAATMALNGKWLLASGEKSGEKLSENRRIYLVMIDGRYMVKIGGQGDQGTFKIDQTKTPNTLTFTSTNGSNAGKKMLAIYQLNKDTLKVCYDLSGKAFPGKFESKAGTPSFFATYHLLKPNRAPGAFDN